MIPHHGVGSRGGRGGGGGHGESILEGPSPVQSGLCGWCLPD